MHTHIYTYISIPREVPHPACVHVHGIRMKGLVVMLLDVPVVGPPTADYSTHQTHPQVAVGVGVRGGLRLGEER